MEVYVTLRTPFLTVALILFGTSLCSAVIEILTNFR